MNLERSPQSLNSPLIRDEGGAGPGAGGAGGEVSGKKPELCREDGRGATFHLNDPEDEGLRRIKPRMLVHLLE